MPTSRVSQLSEFTSQWGQVIVLSVCTPLDAKKLEHLFIC